MSSATHRTVAPAYDVSLGPSREQGAGMSRRYTFVLPPLLLGLLLSAGPVAARQMDARSSPRVRGPLAQIAKDCKSRRERFRGRVIAVARSCVRFYTLAGDSNARRDYGVIW